MSKHKTLKRELEVGQLVHVSPTDPLAVGRGRGTITAVGRTIVLVLFPSHARPISCLRCDVTRKDNTQ